MKKFINSSFFNFLGNYYVEISIFILFAILGFIGIAKHEMWRDELQAWMIARDSVNLADLFRNIQYEGHPALWHLTLFFITRFTHNPVWMQYLHVSIACGTVFIFLFFSPFNKIQKALFAFGYFPFYEYLIISRSYGLNLFFILLFCLLNSRRAGLFYQAIVVFLLTQANLFGAILAFSLTFFLIFQALIKKLNSRKITLLASSLVIISGFALCYLQIVPSKGYSGSGNVSGENVSYNFEKTISSVWEAHMPIPKDSMNFWNSNFINDQAAEFFLALVLLVFLYLILDFYGNRFILIYYFATLVLLLFCLLFLNLFAMRYFGMIFAVTVSALWFCLEKIKQNKYNISLKFFNAFVFVIFFAGFLGGMTAYADDYKYPFSSSLSAAEYIENNNLNDLEIVGGMDYAVSALPGHLDKKIFYLNSQKYGTFIIWNNKRRLFVSLDDIFASAEKVSEEKNKDVLIILNSDVLNSKLNDNPWKGRIIKSFEMKEGVVEDEKFYGYRFRKE